MVDIYLLFNKFYASLVNISKEAFSPYMYVCLWCVYMPNIHVWLGVIGEYVWPEYCCIS